jgi:hypothetical protein
MKVRLTCPREVITGLAWSENIGTTPTAMTTTSPTPAPSVQFSVVAIDDSEDLLFLVRGAL